MASPVADLFAKLGLRIDAASWARGNKAIKDAKKSVDQLDGSFQDKNGRWRAATGRFLTESERRAKGLKNEGKAAKEAGGAFAGLNNTMRNLAVGVGAYIGIRAAGKALIGFNSTVEDSKNQIAGMIALSKDTDLSTELTKADALYASLQKRAATLPGTTAEYVKMASMLTQPLVKAGLGMKQLEDLTVNTTVAAKALGFDAGLAARDVAQALRGQYHSTDPFAGIVLGSIGYSGEDGRKKYNQMSEAKRASELERGLMRRQWDQLAKAQGKTLSGTLSTLQDSLEQFLGKVGLPLFTWLGERIREANAYLEAHQEDLKEIAATVGGVLVDAFKVLGSIFKFLMEHVELTKSILIGFVTFLGLWALKSAAAFTLALGPLGLAIAAIAAIVYAIRNVSWDDLVDGLSAAGSFIVDKMADVGEAIKDAFSDAFDWVAEEAKRLPRRVPILGWLGEKLGQGAAWISEGTAVGKAAGFGGAANGAYENAVAAGQFSGSEEEFNAMVERNMARRATVPSTPTRPTNSQKPVTVSHGGIQVNVTPAPGQNSRELANQIGAVVDDKLNTMLLRTKEAVG